MSFAFLFFSDVWTPAPAFIRQKHLENYGNRDKFFDVRKWLLKKKFYLSSFARSGVLITTAVATGVIDQMDHSARFRTMKFFRACGDRDGNGDDFGGAR